MLDNKGGQELFAIHFSCPPSSEWLIERFPPLADKLREDPWQHSQPESFEAMVGWGLQVLLVADHRVLIL